MHDGEELKVYGGAMATRADGFECHSYETELAAFSDTLNEAEEGSVVVVVTDCLSGGQAGGRWRWRCANDKGGRYRALMLADIERLEAIIQSQP